MIIKFINKNKNGNGIYSNCSSFKKSRLISNSPSKSFTNILEIFKMKMNFLLGPKNFSSSIVPSFENLADKDIYTHTGINPKWTYRNAIKWTPRFYLQKEISGEFLFQLKKFRKLDQWEDIHQVALTQLIITEAIRDTTYEVAYNYKVSPSNHNPFHGLIDILLYNNDPDSNFYPVVPVIFPNYIKEEGVYYERYNNAQIIGMSYCLLQNYKINYSKGETNDDIQFIKAIQTNGHEWCLLEIHDHYVKKTNLFKPKMINPQAGYVPKIFDDYNHIRTIIGLIRYALNIEDNMVLKTSIYSLGEKSEDLLIKNKEAISILKTDSPDLIDDIGLDRKLLDAQNGRDRESITGNINQKGSNHNPNLIK